VSVVFTLLGAIWAGMRLGLHPNPLLGVGAAAVAGLLGGSRKASRERSQVAWGVLAVGWLLGDGLRVLARARDVADGAGRFLGAGQPLWADWTALAIWAVVGFASGYLLPAWVGWQVGRRVTHGTGWLAAGSIAVAVSLALTTLFASVH